jgi:hypothetical protein
MFYGTNDAIIYICTQAVTAMVQQAMEYIDKTPDIETRIELIKTLNSVSAGKVSFVMFEFSIMFYYLLA